MAWCCQATSQYLSQCWPRSLLPWLGHNELKQILKVLLQWNSTSVYTSWTYSTYHLELALGTFIRQFISACLVCHTSQEKISPIRIRKFMVPDIRCVPISHLWRPLCRGCKQIAHVLGNDCDIVFISLKSTENVERVTLSCSYWFTDTVTELLVAVKW